MQAASHLTGLRELNLDDCINVTDEGLRTLSSITAFDTLYHAGCYNVTATGKQALRDDLPNLRLHDSHTMHGLPR